MKYIEPIVQSELYQKLFNNNEKTQNLETIEFIKDGNVILTCFKNDILNNSLKTPDVFDFIIYSKPEFESNNKVNYKKLLYKYPINEEDFIIENTDYRFMLTEINIDNNIIKLDLNKDDYNYFVVDNKIDKYFLTYFLKKYHNYDTEKILENYTLKIIDENICIKETDNFETIILNKKNYDVDCDLNLSFNNTFYGKKVSESIPFSNENSDNESEYSDLPDLELITDDYRVIDDQDFNCDFDCEEEEVEEEYIDNFS
jgi:hypothetical protein